MTTPVARAVLVAVVGSLSLLAPFLHWGTAVLYGAIAIAAIAIPRQSRIFDLLAHPIDYEAGQLRGVASFALAGTALAILGTVEAFELSVTVFVLTLVIVGVGNLGEILARRVANTESVGAVAFVVTGIVASVAGWRLLELLDTGEGFVLGAVVFFGSIGALVGALCRTDFYRRDDPVVLLTVGFVLWLLSFMPKEPHIELVLIALAVTSAMGGMAYALETASVAGMLSGILVGYITVVYAGFAWFALLLAFFGIGGLATKYRYDEKMAKGVAERRRGARGTGNVLGNSLVAVLAVFAYVGAFSITWFDGTLAAIAFGGAVATALADTLSSEIGSLQDEPRLVTTFERVSAGTDGAVTVLGTTAGAIGAAIIAVMSYILIGEIAFGGAIIVFVAGVVGMFADSLFGATLENKLFGNQGVNLLATGVGALSATLMEWSITVTI